MKRGLETGVGQLALKMRQIEIQMTHGENLEIAYNEIDVSEQSYKGECPKQNIFYSIKEARTVIGFQQNTYNRVRSHSPLGYRPPAPITFPDVVFRLPLDDAISIPLIGSVQNTDEVSAMLRTSGAELQRQLWLTSRPKADRRKTTLLGRSARVRSVRFLPLGLPGA